MRISLGSPGRGPSPALSFCPASENLNSSGGEFIRRKNGKAHYELRTFSGADFAEVSSAFQKAIRRGLEEEAIHWAVELDLSGYAEYAWKRMKIISSEDVGLAEPNISANIQALYQMWQDQRKKADKKHAPENLFFLHAVLLLVRAKKSRLIDWVAVTAYRNHPPREIPDWARDMHTLQGRCKGRGTKYFFEEGTRLENHAVIAEEEHYREEARKYADKPRLGCGSLFDGEEAG